MRITDGALCKTAALDRRAEILLGWADAEAEMSCGRNADLRAARMDADLALLVDALRAAEVQYLHADTEKLAVRIAADLVQTRVQLLGMLYRRQAT